MSPERQAAAFGAAPIEAQIEQARAFYGAFRSADSNWKLEEHPFLRGTTDPWIVSSQIALEDGAVAPPVGAVVLGRAVRSLRDHAAQRPHRCDREPLVAGHARVARAEESRSSAKERRDRYEMVRFAQAVFRNIEGDRGVDALVALGGYRRYRALLLTLDRMEITTPRVYARVVEAARRLDDDCRAATKSTRSSRFKRRWRFSSARG